MKKLIALVCLGFVFAVSSPAFAGEQQDKMKGCNKEAKGKGLKGDERKAFMKKCLSKDYQLKSGSPAAASATPASTAASAASAPSSAPQDKMKACSAEARTKGLKADERKSFMSACLKG
ncbi:MAG TPA: PsiF family protein [Gallionella sp.]|nr:PsiF family protein [Gallionella sp.]